MFVVKGGKHCELLFQTSAVTTSLGIVSSFTQLTQTQS